MSQPGAADTTAIAPGGSVSLHGTTERTALPAGERAASASQSAIGASAARGSMDDTDFFLPDFCEPRIVLAVVLIGALLSLMLALSSTPEAGFLIELARLSVFVQWVGLTSAGLICASRPRLEGLRTPAVVAAVFVLLLGNVAVLSAVAVGAGRWLQARGFGGGLFPLDLWPFLARNAGIALIAGALVLRYYFVSYQWRRHVRAEASARIDALHARIRPHFLFNSLNTIASLIGSDRVRAEEAVEDLADLFRANLREAGASITFGEELELARVYERIEQARLGDRLRVQWNVGAIPVDLQVPSLMLQPLLENAINHGVEPLAEGGTITVEGHVEAQQVRLTVTNPIAGARGVPARTGNRVALDNIRARLALAYAERASLRIAEGPAEFSVELRLPVTG